VKRLGARYCLAKDKAFVRKMTGSSARACRAGASTRSASSGASTQTCRTWTSPQSSTAR
jgi:hypothetical protein